MNKSKALLKIYFEEKTKRCALPKDFKEMKEIVMKSFNNISEPFDIYYMDEEKEFILIENQFDFENALMFIKENNSALKITVRMPGDKYDRSIAIKYLDSSLVNSINLSKISIDKKRADEILIDTTMNLNCERCGRKFSNRNSHLKHTRICARVFGSKRKPFDSRRQRIKEIQMLKDEKNMIENMNSKLENDMEALKSAMGKWKKSCKKLHKNMKIGKPFKDLFIDLNSKQCDNCRRNFNEKSYNKHIRSCNKLMTKRKPFDSKKQRINSLEQAVMLRRSDMMNKAKELFSNDEDKKSKCKKSQRWRKLSERFRTIMRISKLLYKSK